MISIVIPTREEERAIEGTIRQFDRLSIPHEIIVSDAGSHDRTVEIARSAGARVVENTSGIISPGHQRKDGARVASGEFILFLDTTVRLPDVDQFLTKALAHFEDPHVVGLALPQWIYPEIATRVDNIILAITNSIIGRQKMGSGKFMLVRRAAYETIGGFRDELITREDGDVFMRLKKVGRVEFDRSLPFFYEGRREHGWGWAKLLYIWLRDTLWVLLFDRSLSKDWTPVR